MQWGPNNPQECLKPGYFHRLAFKTEIGRDLFFTPHFCSKKKRHGGLQENHGIVVFEQEERPKMGFWTLLHLSKMIYYKCGHATGFMAVTLLSFHGACLPSREKKSIETQKTTHSRVLGRLWGLVLHTETVVFYFH